MQNITSCICFLNRINHIRLQGLYSSKDQYPRKNRWFLTLRVSIGVSASVLTLFNLESPGLAIEKTKKLDFSREKASDQRLAIKSNHPITDIPDHTG